jgi:AraC family transcriptional regulator
MDTRATLLATPALTVEILRCRLGPTPLRSAPTARRQVLFPLVGTFHWHVGRTTNVLDPNHVMFVETDEESVDTHPTPTEVTCLIATVSELTARRLWRSPRPFRERVARISSRVQAHQIWLANVLRAEQPAARSEERVLELLAAVTAEAEPTRAPSSHAAALLARRAKALFADRGELIALSELAELLDVSPAHLTDSFRRAEGVPIVRYQIQLRIARALRELPHANDLSALALALGFASHSHFATAFRAHTGLTPSQFRAATRRGDTIETIRKRAGASPG